MQKRCADKSSWIFNIGSTVRSRHKICLVVAGVSGVVCGSVVICPAYLKTIPVNMRPDLIPSLRAEKYFVEVLYVQIGDTVMLSLATPV